jgi:HEAT repeat protein
VIFSARRGQIDSSRVFFPDIRQENGAFDALVSTFRDEDYDVRREAAAALRRIGDPRAALPVAEQLGREDDMRVRIECAKALGRFADPVAIPYLIDAIETPRDIQYWAVKSLEELTGEEFGTDGERWRKWYNRTEEERH